MLVHLLRRMKNVKIKGRKQNKTWPVSRLGLCATNNTKTTPEHSENTKGQRQNSYKQHCHSIKSK